MGMCNKNVSRPSIQGGEYFTICRQPTVTIGNSDRCAAHQEWNTGQMSRVSVILANLTPEDFQRFHAGRVPYSGSTGAGAKPESYGGLAPYIATVGSELTKAVEAMGWPDYSVVADGEQWIVRRVGEVNMAQSGISALQKMFPWISITPMQNNSDIALSCDHCQQMMVIEFTSPMESVQAVGDFAKMHSHRGEYFSNEKPATIKAGRMIELD